MSQIISEHIRNIAVVGHGDAGKTSFVSAALYASGSTNRFFSVDEGNTITDFDDDEIRRKISISTGICYTAWKKIKINILDTPGYSDFICDAFPALRSVDTAVFVVNAGAGVECNLEKVWEAEKDLPASRVILVNKLDRENTSFDSSIELLQTELSKRIVPIALPVGKEASFKGLICLITQKMYRFDESGSGKYTIEDIPRDMADDAEMARAALIEAVAEADDELLEKYLEGEEITSREIANGLKLAILNGIAYPAIPISASKNIGVTYFLDFSVDYLPSPCDLPHRKINETELICDSGRSLVAQIFKTIIDPYTGKISVFRVYSGSIQADSTVRNATRKENEKITGLCNLFGKTQNPASSIAAGDIGVVIKLKESRTGDTLCSPDQPVVMDPIEYPDPLFSQTFVPESKSDEEKISTSLTRLAEEDPTLRYRRSSETNELIVFGMGQLHLEVTHNRLKRKYGVSAIMKSPKIPYRETVKGNADVRYRHKKQSGGAGQFGEVAIRLKPLPHGEGFVFDNMIVGGVIPGQYIPSVEKGVRNTMGEGILAGYPVTDIKVELYDGKSHPVDSKDIAFQIAGAMALKQAFMQANPILLEPVMSVKIIVPEANMGDVMGDLASRRGRVTGMGNEGNKQVINGLVPMAEMLKFEPELRSMTGGRGTFSMEFDHYEELPSHLAESVVAETKKSRE
ncbi:elongation factor G [bacterium]|nr:elongation factor G [candidate division CSSED10-310 bacterium]